MRHRIYSGLCVRSSLKFTGCVHSLFTAIYNFMNVSICHENGDKNIIMFGFTIKISTKFLPEVYIAHNSSSSLCRNKRNVNNE